MKRPLFIGAIVIVIVSAALRRLLTTSSRSCGWTLPGAPSLWAAQAGSLYLSDDGEAAMWPAHVDGESEPLVLRMPFLGTTAIEQVDAQTTSVPVLRPEELERARQMRTQMVPHVIRGLFDGRLFGPESALAELSGVRGGSKESYNASNDGLIESYFGSELEVPLRKWVGSANAGYWLACLETRDQQDSEEGAQWLRAVARTLERHALLGLSRSSASELCFRVSRGRSRVQIHSDAFHGFLAQLGNGPRSVLLWMPDTVSLLEAALSPDGSGGVVPISQLDPRRARDADAPPGFQRAPTLVATLQPGDALHIPVAWFHYVESGSAADSETVSVAVSARTDTTSADSHDRSPWSLLTAWSGARSREVDRDADEPPPRFVEVPCANEG